MITLQDDSNSKGGTAMGRPGPPCLKGGSGIIIKRDDRNITRNRKAFWRESILDNQIVHLLGSRGKMAGGNAGDRGPSCALRDLIAPRPEGAMVSAVRGDVTRRGARYHWAKLEGRAVGGEEKTHRFGWPAWQVLGRSYGGFMKNETAGPAVLIATAPGIDLDRRAGWPTEGLLLMVLCPDAGTLAGHEVESSQNRDVPSPRKGAVRARPFSKG